MSAEKFILRTLALVGIICSVSSRSGPVATHYCTFAVSTMNGFDFKEHELHVHTNIASPSNVHLCFYFANDYHKMERTTDETMKKTLVRFSKTLEKKLAKKSAKKKLKSQHASEVAIEVTFEGKELPIETLTNNEWKTNMTVVVDTHRFIAVVNPPLVEQFSIFPRKFVAVGTILVPSAR